MAHSPCEIVLKPGCNEPSVSVFLDIMKFLNSPMLPLSKCTCLWTPCNESIAAVDTGITNLLCRLSVIQCYIAWNLAEPHERFMMVEYSNM